ncbi:MAG: hypothetical protein O7I42_01615 [Alphaproteobacteria bacterium]|nr:hypothetical protein [Alphaproteobacteria bacterium]
MVRNPAHLRRILTSCLVYYHRMRCHVSLDKDASDGRPVQAVKAGNVVAFPRVGGVHHRYQRIAA